jgi:dUTPase
MRLRTTMTLCAGDEEGSVDESFLFVWYVCQCLVHTVRHTTQVPMELAVQLLCENASLPSRATSGAAGYDITCTETVERVVTAGERVAQMLVVPVPELVLTERACLSPTDRGQGGFGSTGA